MNYLAEKEPCVYLLRPGEVVDPDGGVFFISGFQNLLVLHLAGSDRPWNHVTEKSIAQNPNRLVHCWFWQGHHVWIILWSCIYNTFYNVKKKKNREIANNFSLTMEKMSYLRSWRRNNHINLSLGSVIVVYKLFASGDVPLWSQPFSGFSNILSQLHAKLSVFLTGCTSWLQPTHC